ncbi:ABC transporter permease [Rhodococcus erythropolis]|uniref:MlaE family ABC transporter permease n=1 Tax=Rhodococcus erythropolis TaxID=1833 RepID=UPI001E3CC6F3|nr:MULTISPECIES: ABC transporter permease [Rhodococcus erythropolis group]MCD2107909.1 ABC transporter permease [Rhodococcus qingshengii]MCZ4527080.1 ABC transporter permease [Rhodococcus erythropolis]
MRSEQSAATRALRTTARSLGEFYFLSIETARALLRPQFPWREFVEQCWFIARVSLLPTVLMSVPFTVLVVFTLNSLLTEIGASDLSGAGAGLGAVTQIGPLVTVLVVAGAAATAITADLGSRTIREEIDAMEVLGLDPIVRLVAPRVVAATLVAALLNGAVCAIGLIGGFFFSVYLQNVTPGAYASGITLLVGLGDLVLSEIKAALFGMIAALVACHRGLSVAGGAKSVGSAVNETVVFSFVALFLVNMILTSIGLSLNGSAT